MIRLVLLYGLKMGNCFVAEACQQVLKIAGVSYILPILSISIGLKKLKKRVLCKGKKEGQILSHVTFACD